MATYLDRGTRGVGSGPSDIVLGHCRCRRLEHALLASALGMVYCDRSGWGNVVNISLRLVGILGMIRRKDLSPQLMRPRAILWVQ